MTRHDPALIAGALAAMETAVNRALALAPASSHELAELAGTVVAIDMTEPDISCHIVVTPTGQLQLRSIWEAAVTTRVRGRLDSFVALAAADDPAATLINSDLEVLGSSAPLLALQQVVTRMDVDWEAPLVNALGDVAGHQLAQALRGSFRWGGQAASSLRRQLSEYILEEGRLSPPAAELEHFYRQIQTLTLHVDRLESRVRRLRQRITGADA